MDKFLAPRNRLPKQKRACGGNASSAVDMPSAPSSKKRPSHGEQTYLDLGQRSFGRMTECRECGFMYTEGEPTDEAAHRKHHRKSHQGIRIRGALATLRVVSNRDDGRNIILLLPSDGAEAVRKLHEVRAALELSLGGCSSSLRASSQSDDAAAAAAPPLPPCQKAFLCIESQTGRLCGAALAEAVSSAYRAVPPEPNVEDGEEAEEEGSADPTDFFRGRASVLRHDSVACEAMCGISHIWVDGRDRRCGVARALLDEVRRHYVTGFDVPRDKLAFSQPTALGRRLAASYSTTERFLVYE